MKYKLEQFWYHLAQPAHKEMSSHKKGFVPISIESSTYWVLKWVQNQLQSLLAHGWLNISKIYATFQKMFKCQIWPNLAERPTFEHDWHYSMKWQLYLVQSIKIDLKKLYLHSFKKYLLWLLAMHWLTDLQELKETAHARATG